MKNVLALLRSASSLEKKVPQIGSGDEISGNSPTLQRKLLYQTIRFDNCSIPVYVIQNRIFESNFFGSFEERHRRRWQLSGGVRYSGVGELESGSRFWLMPPVLKQKSPKGVPITILSSSCLAADSCTRVNATSAPATVKVALLVNTTHTSLQVPFTLELPWNFIFIPHNPNARDYSPT